MHSWSKSNLQWTKTYIVNDDLEEPAVIPKATTESSVEATQAVAKGRLPPQLDVVAAKQTQAPKKRQLEIVKF